MRAAVRELCRVPPGTVPGDDALRALAAAWRNDGFAATVEYLRECAARSIATGGPVLDCGSGLTSIVLATVAGRAGVEVWSLEHSEEWGARVAGVLSRIPGHGVRLRVAPLRSYGAFDWYDAPTTDMPRDFALVVCDGPPGETPGGRIGMLPRMHGHLAPGATILLDDAVRPGEADVLRQWQADSRARVEVHRRDEHDIRGYAVMTLP